jgi:hypothetical protein
MKIPDFLIRFFGERVASKLNLQEGLPMPTKPWYESKVIWSDICTIALSILGIVDKYATHGTISGSPYYSMALTFLGALGIYGRSTATTIIAPTKTP